MSNNSMKNLFFHSLRSKQTLVTVVSLLLFLAVVSFVLFEGTKKTVALTVNGEQQDILTPVSYTHLTLPTKRIV